MLKKQTNRLKTLGIMFGILCVLAFVVLLENLTTLWPEAPEMFKPTSELFTVLKKGAVYALLAVSMNLLNGFTGLFSLGQAGFMLLGAYTYAIFTVPMAAKDQVYYLYGGSSVKFSLMDMFASVFNSNGVGSAFTLVFTVLCGLILAGLVAALFAALIGTPVLRLKSDYLAIATLGFAEILRAVFQWQTLGPVTNGANMIKSFPTFADFNVKLEPETIEKMEKSLGHDLPPGTMFRLSTLVPFLIAIICIVLIVCLIKSSYGRAFKSIRDDEVAAEAMGINLFKHKMMSFITSSFFAGVGGALFAMYVSNAQAKVFTSAMTYEILLIVVIGGIGSVSGSVLASFLYVACSEWWLRFLDNEMVVEGEAKTNFTIIFAVVIAAIVGLVFWRQNRKGKNFIMSTDVKVGQTTKKKHSVNYGLLFLSIVATALLVWDVLFAVGDQTKVPLLGSGFRMVVFSVVIMIIVLFFSRGIMGDKEISFKGIGGLLKKFFAFLKKKLVKSKAEVKGQQQKTVLHVENITMQFGGVVAVNNLSLDIPEGKIVALIGPNGAGKTTAFNCITGVYQPTNGKVEFMGKTMVCSHPTGKMKRSYKGENARQYAGKRVKDPKPNKITKLGISRTFQNIRLWKSMTVFENVLIAKHMRAKQNMFSAIFRSNKAEEKRMRAETMELLKEQGLDQYADEIATSLPYGLQRRLEIARALATDPKLLLLDEPAAGMNPQETLELAEYIREIRETHNLTIFLIEHHMDLVMKISDYIYVIDFGSEIARGVPKEVQQNQRVIDAYLGVAEDE